MHFVQAGWTVVGIENDMRAKFFGLDASTAPMSEMLAKRFPDEFIPTALDIRDTDGIDHLFVQHADQIELVLHTAAQPPA